MHAALLRNCIAHAIVTMETRTDNNKEMDGDDDRGLPEMVMERSGRFEVVELQAELVSKDQESSGTLHTDTTTEESTQVENQQNSKDLYLQESQTEELASSINTDVQHQHHEHVPESHLPQTTDLTTITPVTEEQAVVPPVATDDQNKQHKPANIKPPPKDTITADNTGRVEETQPISVRYQQRGELKPMKQIRMQSAPGSRLMQSVHRQHETKEMKRKLTEAAFGAWVSRKNSERRKSARARLKSETTEEDKQKKKEMCETVYQNWLEVKKKEQRVLSRPSTSVPKKDEEMCRQTFENWKKRKQTQHLDEIKKDQIKARDLAEAAEKADTSVIEKSYKQ